MKYETKKKNHLTFAFVNSRNPPLTVNERDGKCCMHISNHLKEVRNGGP